MLRAVHAAHDAMDAAAGREVAIDALAAAPALRGLAEMRSWPDDEADERAGALSDRIRAELEAL
jgi:hypothetical protein